MKKLEQIDPHACAIVATLQTKGFTAYFAGGCVRDMLMERVPKDYDIATSATPDQVMEIFQGAVHVGKSFGVVRVPGSDGYYDIATFRKDHDYQDGRHPSEVTFTDPETDAGRRDFTVNALFFDPLTNELLDYTGGVKDIEARVIRCVGTAKNRFAEDHLRVLRAIRFACSLDFTLDTETSKAIKQSLDMVPKIAPERVRDECTRMLLESVNAGYAIRLMDNLGILEKILPEISRMKGVDQPPDYHPEGDVFIHTTNMLDKMNTDNPILAWSILLHDCGKPVTQKLMDNRIRFRGHEHKGVKIAKGILERFRFSSKYIETITHCVANHSKFMHAPEMRTSKLRQLIGARTFHLELELHKLDRMCGSGDLSSYEFIKDFAAQYNNTPALPDPWVSGNDILQIGVPRGPGIGEILREAYDAQLEGKFENREELLEWVKKGVRSSEFGIEGK